MPDLAGGHAVSNWASIRWLSITLLRCFRATCLDFRMLAPYSAQVESGSPGSSTPANAQFEPLSIVDPLKSKVRQIASDDCGIQAAGKPPAPGVVGPSGAPGVSLPPGVPVVPGVPESPGV